MRARSLALVLFSLHSSIAFSHGMIETMLVEGRQTNLLGKAGSASEGIVGQEDIAIRPILRTGEVLELVPGMVATQHSGTGKANQYFLRGFNLDHGTDFSTFVNGMPVNMRTHGHGQGYTDLNFLIPETVSELSYKKGPYYAEVGDFSGAGGVQINTLHTLKKGTAEIQVGEDNYLRLLAMNDFEIAGGNTLFAFEGNQYDGPWSNIDEDLDKKNLLIKHSKNAHEKKFNLTFMAYDSSWNSADQIPSRAVEQGITDELGSLDTLVGGESNRYSLSINWERKDFKASAYIIKSELNLWSNFTYFLDDETNGDQFEQVDKRTIYGGQVEQTIKQSLSSLDTTHRIGAELRVDAIDEVGLYHTQERERLGVIRKDEVTESSLGIFWENQIKWNENFRSVIGLRYDYYDFDTKNKAGTNTNGINLDANTGTADDSLVSLKGSLIYAINSEWETYVSAGQGFHSNDARGTTIQLDPSDGSAIDSVDPLVRSFGYETGIRGFINDRINTSIALWHLESDSELLFVGDAGNTEASRASERNGLEATFYYYFKENWNFELEYGYTDAEFSDNAPEGNKIPGSLKHVLQAGLNANLKNGWFGSLRVRHFGERPLVEDNSIQSDPSTIWNLRAGYTQANWTFKTDILNLTDSDDHDIDYYYESRLASETSGEATEDLHYHVMEPRTIRVSVKYNF